MNHLINLFKSRASNTNIEVVEKSEFKKRIASSDVKVIDVRTPLEFNRGHIEGASNSNVFNKNKFLKDLKSLNKKKPVCVYCQSGNRSRMASKIMADLEFERVYDLKGAMQTGVFRVPAPRYNPSILVLLLPLLEPPIVLHFLI
jgi:rhodanese-related sulfurtransferase